MFNPRSSWLACSVAQVAIWLALLVVSLGLSRFLVVCTGPHCHGAIEIAHLAGSCCDHEHEVAAPADELGDQICEGHGQCVDEALGIDIGPLPQQLSSPHSDVACFGPSPTAAFLSLWARAVAMLPPITGPPRTDPRTALLATTTLLL